MFRRKGNACAHCILYQTIPKEVTNALREDLNEGVTIDVVAMLDQIGFLVKKIRRRRLTVEFETYQDVLIGSMDQHEKGIALRWSFALKDDLREERWTRMPGKSRLTK